MTERREIKQRSPAVWAKVREAYLAGEPAASVARRFDVGPGNLRHRAREEGWTRRDHMAAQAQAESQETTRLNGAWAPPAVLPASIPDEDQPRIGDPLWADPEAGPQEAIRQTLILAGRKLARGKAKEAQELIKGAEALGAVGGGVMPTLIDLERQDDGADILLDAYIRAIQHETEDMVFALFEAEPEPPPGHEHWFLNWRRDNLNPTPHDTDRDRLIAAGREDLTAALYDNGVLKTPPADRPALIEATTRLLTALSLHDEFGGTKAARITLKQELLEAAKKVAG